MVYSLFHEFDSLFNNLFYNFPKEVKPPLDTNIVKSGGGVEKVILQAALAGFKEEDVKVWYEDNTLFIKGSNIKESQENTILPKFLSNFQWKFPVSEKIDLKNSEVTLKDGLLTIVLPVINPVKEKKFLLGK